MGIISSYCDDGLDAKMKGYDRIMKSFSKYFNQEDLSYILDRKANIRDFKDLQSKVAQRSHVDLIESNLEKFKLRIK